jgi:predicted nucleic acid-binding protein
MILVDNSPIDCCIAQLAIENGVLLLHRDHDFERITKVRHFREEFFQ